jgi:anti-sigma factor RsiW
MKDSKFIELLNLYVDNQITPADAAWLESEIQQKPERRQIYRQYCQMQKACVLLAENFRTGAPAAAVVADGGVVEFEPRPRRLARAVYTIGALAAAACVAFVVVNRRSADLAPAAVPPATAEQTVAAVTTPATPAVQVVQTKREMRPVLQPAFAGLIRDGASSDAMLTTAERANFEWMSRVQLDRMPSRQMWFDARPTLQTQDLMFRSRPSSQMQAENAAFRFQR